MLGSNSPWSSCCPSGPPPALQLPPMSLGGILGLIMPPGPILARCSGGSIPLMRWRCCISIIICWRSGATLRGLWFGFMRFMTPCMLRISICCGGMPRCPSMPPMGICIGMLPPIDCTPPLPICCCMPPPMPPAPCGPPMPMPMPMPLGRSPEPLACICMRMLGGPAAAMARRIWPPCSIRRITGPAFISEPFWPDMPCTPAGETAWRPSREGLCPGTGGLPRFGPCWLPCFFCCACR
mmetsp:Transcript_28782/g.72241  ORF Transcript_28782/g.72241 Transcript_28782/m.72241 type:complete len:238 (-) Transcript_28782:290-1003(-)